MITYKDAGVDVERGYEAVRRMKQHVAATFDENVLGGLGSFGGFYSIENADVDKPVLVAGTDGVGTKLKLAFLMDKHDTVGIDCVAMCVNDVVCQGAKPLIFLDYIATGYLDPAKVEQIVAGVADGCRQAGCALIGGETAEMPDFYPAGEYDLAGFTVGLVGREQSISGERVAEGDVLGRHGLLRRAFQRLFAGAQAGADRRTRHSHAGGSARRKELGRNPAHPDQNLREARAGGVQSLRCARHCAHHGRRLHREYPAHSARRPERADRARHVAGSACVHGAGKARRSGRQAGLQHFNMGIGMVFAVKEEEADKLVATLEEQGEKAYRIGRVAKTAADGERLVLL